nr:HEAT repeat domain-containing protein [uncultured Cellulosilyticum sp.]
MEFIKDTPENIKELVSKANNKGSWKVRLWALDELKKYDCQQTRDVVTRLALHDKVFKVKEEAFRVAQALGIKKQGKPIYLGKKDIGFKAKDFTKTFARVKREAKMEELDLELFKDRFQHINPEMYDVMSYEKGNKFEDWIINTYKSLPKK